jgi:hypothetical protein
VGIPREKERGADREHCGADPCLGRPGERQEHDPGHNGNGEHHRMEPPTQFRLESNGFGCFFDDHPF